MSMVLFYLYAVASSPLPIKVIDSDNSGIVSLIEAMDTFDIAERSIIRTTENCTQYYWLKDGLTVHEVCVAKSSN